MNRLKEHRMSSVTKSARSFVGRTERVGQKRTRVATRKVVLCCRWGPYAKGPKRLPTSLRRATKGESEDYRPGSKENRYVWIFAYLDLARACLGRPKEGDFAFSFADRSCGDVAVTRVP